MEKNSRPRSVTVVVPVHNSREHLPEVLKPLMSELRSEDELIVADDRSTDGTADVARGLGAVTVPSTGRPGAAGTRNTGAFSGVCDWILFVDSDAIVPAGWRNMLADRIEEGFEAVQAVYSRHAAGDNPATFYKNYYYHYTFTRRIRKRFISGCGTFFFAVRADTFRKLNGFDDRISGATIEDADFAERLTGAGGKILLAPEMEVFHLREYTLGKLIRYDWNMMKAKTLYLLRRGRRHGRPSVSMASPGEMLAVLTGAVGVWGMPSGLIVLLAGGTAGPWIAVAGFSSVVLGHFRFWLASARQGGTRGILAGFITFPDLMLVIPAVLKAAVISAAGRKY